MTAQTSPQRSQGKFDVARTGPGTLAGQYMRRFWHPIRISSTVPNGKAFPLRIMGENFTLYRGEDGTPHVVDFKCPHRGTQLSTGSVEGDAIRCLYHGWKFAANGQCVEQANEHRSFAENVRIRSYPAQDYLGLIFVYFGPDPAPPMPRFAQLEGPGYLDQTFYIRECNYFQNLENMVDETHANFTHRVSSFSDPGSINREVPKISAEEREYGLVELAHRTDKTIRSSHFIMPNAMLMQLPLPTAYAGDHEASRLFSDYIAWRVPIDDDVHLSCAVQRLNLDKSAAERFFRAKEEISQAVAALPPAGEVTHKILAGELSMDDIADRPDLINIQDHVTQIGQGLIASRDGEKLGPADSAVILLRRIWYRELRQLEAAGPLKQWTVPAFIETTSGLAV